MTAMPLELSVDLIRDGDTIRTQSFVAERRRMIKIGRRLSCDLCLNDRGASRVHAAIDLSPTGAILMDLGSSVGCLVNGERTSKVALADGDLIRIASTTLVVRLGEAKERAPAVARTTSKATSRTTRDTSTGGVRAELVRQLAAAPAELVFELRRFSDYLHQHRLQPVAARSVADLPAQRTAPRPPPLPPEVAAPSPTEYVEAALVSAVGESAAGPISEKYNTLRLVSQMRRERRRTHIGTAGVAVLLALGMFYLVAEGHAGVATRGTADFIAAMTETVESDAVSVETAAVPSAPEPQRSVAIHVVQRGDTLGSIAATHFGDYRQASAVFAANRDILEDPQRIEIGMELRLPGR